jgi:ATP-dependent Clp protease protease subunit
MERKEFEEALLKKRILLLVGEITREKAIAIREQLLFLNSQSNEEIKLIIDSPGGEIVAALLLYEFISYLEAPVHCIVNGECSSSGVIVLQAGKRRLATESSFFLSPPFGCHF